MTFKSFYTIIRPHNTASYNTVKRAKGIIGYIVEFSFLYHIPQMLTAS